VSVELRRALDTGMMQRWGEVTSDFNPVHVDAEFASTTVYGRPIVHATLTVAVVSELLDSTYGRDWIDGGSIDVRFVAPLFVGDTLRVSTTPEADEPAVVVESVESGDQPLVVALTLASDADDRGDG